MRTGNTSATSTSQCGSTEAATNTPEMKYRGSITAWVMGWAESWFRITEASAKPRQQKEIAPTTTVTARAGAVRPGTAARWKIQPYLG